MSGCGLGQRIDEGKGRDTIILQFTSSICPCCKRKNEAEQWAIAAVLTKMNDSSDPGNLNAQEMSSAHVKYNHDKKNR
jgi:RNA polymerase subunit RPABC4/transcription elongation factor Spt4